MKRRLLKYGSIVAAIAFLAVFYGLAIHNTPGTEAVKATDFNPGRIIDDAIFYNPDTMTVEEIQAFLDAKLPTCDMWGTGSSAGRIVSETGYVMPAGSTNADYARLRAAAGNSRYHEPPYVCVNKYYENPSYFKNSYNFIHNVCPGFYVKTKDGIGSMAYISISQLSVYYRFKDKENNMYVRDDIYSGTEEVLQTTNITNSKDAINRLVNDNSCTYLKTPAGIFTEMTLPVDEITLNHENDTLNTAKIILRKINNIQHTPYSLETPTTLLMIERDSMYTFFEKNKITDGVQSYLSTISGNNYVFSNISNLVRKMSEAKKSGLKSNSNWTIAHPNWNKVVIIPVVETYAQASQASVLAKVTHDMKLSSVRLVGGSGNPYDDIKISVIYSKFAGR